jgi:hypothetical protein
MSGEMRTARLVPRDVEYAEPSFGSLPERMALDLSVANLGAGRPGVTILITASPSAAREVMWRVADPVVIVAHSTESERSIRKRLASEVDRDRGTTISTIEGFDPLSSRHVERVLWLRPTRATLDAGVALIDRAAQDSALVAVVGSGPLDRWRVGRRVRFRRSDSAVDPFDVARILGFKTEQEWRVLGLRSAVNAPVAIAARRVDRWDIADRAEARYRLSLIEPGAPRLWALGVWIGRRSTFAS